MNTKMIIAAVVVLLVLGGGAAVIFMNQSKNVGEGAENGSMIQGEGTDASGATSLRALMQENARQQCAFTSEEGGMSSSGTVYFGNGNMRGDFVSESEGQSYEAHMIVDGNDVYVWQDGESQGMKSTLDATADFEGQTEQNIDFDQEVDYDCRSWSVDTSMFNLPAGVEFVDVSAMLEGSLNLTEQQCAACDQLGSAAAQCRAALGCE